MKVVKKVIYVAMASFCLNLTVSSQNITLKMSNITVKQAMDELKSRSGYSFEFSLLYSPPLLSLRLHPVQNAPLPLPCGNPKLRLYA